jgi:hypothetical protein
MRAESLKMRVVEETIIPEEEFTEAWTADATKQ